MSDYVRDVVQSDFAERVIGASQPVLVDFWATWCPPCRAMSPAIEAVAKDYASRAQIVKVNIDESPELASQYRINNIPTLVLFHQGAEQDRIVGAVAKEAIVRLIDRHLA